MLSRFPFYKQLDSMDCGPTCLRIIAKYYGKTYTLDALREKTFISRQGVNFLTLSEAAENLGFRTLAIRTNYDQLYEEVPLPCIAHWRQNHFIVIYKMTKNKVYVSDPAHGRIIYTKEEFLKGWASMAKDEGFLLLFETTPRFLSKESDDKDEKKIGLKYFASYFLKYKKFLIQIFLGFLASTLLSMALPFLTQSLVDKGIMNQNIGFVNTILIAQLILTISQSAIGFIQSWISLHLNTRVNISIISDFLMKLMRLPMKFFDTKHIGDILQRISDHSRIEAFLKSSTLGTIFSMFNFIIYGVIMAIYSWQILTIFFVTTLLSAGWVVLFLKIRRDLDYKSFHISSENQTTLIQLINGTQTLKLHNAERQRRWAWERIQARLFKLSVKGLAVGQYQQAGSLLIGQLQNIIISYIVAKQVIDGQLTLGSMMAIQYILGQLSAPFQHFISLITSAQDAKISLERIGEILNKEDEETADENKLYEIPTHKPLVIKNVSFQYEGPKSENVLDNVSFEIPNNKVTAIVGSSGSGKTTLIKLLLKFYKPAKGDILLGSHSLDTNYNTSAWRSKCGIVMQESFIFSDSIARNIAIGDDKIDRDKLIEATQMANIREFIEEDLPLAYNTKIGADGHGLSQGQIQRILIARAIYKNPQYIFFDEATNSLDANNERIIINNLNKFFKGRTAVVVAHRLSTVKNADQIIVIEKGKIVESGTHSALVKKKGQYYTLVKNQLELG